MSTTFTHHRADPGSQTQSAQVPGVFLLTNTLETGGSERQFVNLANALERGKYSVHLGCLKAVGPFLRDVPAITEFSPGGNLFQWHSQRARLRLARHLRRLKVAVAHSFDFYSNLMLIPAARLAGVPVVIGSHRQIGDLLTAKQFWAQKTVFRLCDRVVCNSRAAADRLRQAGVVEAKLSLIPNAIPDEVFAPAFPALARDSETVIVGLISRMNDRVKRHDAFLRVAAKLADRLPQARFVLVGDGPLRPGLEALVTELHIADRVRFLGDRRDIPAVLASLDVSVLPSSSESLSNVILESMAAGLPVVASRSGGNPELVQDGQTGFLFEPGNEGHFANALEKLIREPELRKRLGACARNKAAAYNLANVRTLYQDLYLGELLRKGWLVPSTGAKLQALHTLC